jgi:hypothetical protein
MHSWLLPSANCQRKATTSGVHAPSPVKCDNPTVCDLSLLYDSGHFQCLSDVNHVIHVM